MPTLKCTHCGNIFYRKQSRVKTEKVFCDKKCYIKYRQSGVYTLNGYNTKQLNKVKEFATLRKNAYGLEKS